VVIFALAPLFSDVSLKRVPEKQDRNSWLPEQTISLGSLFVFATFVDVVYLTLGYIAKCAEFLEARGLNKGRIAKAILQLRTLRIELKRDFKKVGKKIIEKTGRTDQQQNWIHCLDES
jgi:hypothetical protein